MERSGKLTPEEKQRLARFLSEQLRRDDTRAQENATPRVRHDRETGDQSVAWLKAHADEYAGQHVALNGDQLVGSGRTIRAAQMAAQRNGYPHALLVHVPPKEGGTWGGW
jgi:pyrimidine operon attenuation protein/uracil phosphoribosyltransferase